MTNGCVLPKGEQAQNVSLLNRFANFYVSLKIKRDIFLSGKENDIVRVKSQ